MKKPKHLHTEITCCTVLQLAAVDRAIRTERQFQLLSGKVPWTRRDLGLLERLRNVRGLNVIEKHLPGGVFVTIAGSLLPGGFTTIVCQK